MGSSPVGIRVEDDHGVLPRVVAAADAVDATEPEPLPFSPMIMPVLPGYELAGRDI